MPVEKSWRGKHERALGRKSRRIECAPLHYRALREDRTLSNVQKLHLAKQVTQALFYINLLTEGTQTMEEIKVVWCGMDVSKDEFYAALDLPGEDGNKITVAGLKAERFKRTEKGLNRFWNWVDKNSKDYTVRFVMESTGYLSRQLFNWMKEQRADAQVSIHNARYIANFIKSLNLPHKTDKSDAQAIARFGSERTPTPRQRVAKHWDELKEYQRQRAALIKIRVELENRSPSLFFGETNTINDNTIAAIKLQIKKIDKVIRAHVNEHQDIRKEVHFMCTVPGVQFISACTIIAELGSMTQYSAKQLSAMSGLAPRIRSSGSSLNQSFMGRCGSTRLRQILYLDSIQSVAKIPSLNNLYKRLIQRGKSKMSARCACMRKLLLILRAVVVTSTNYDEKLLKNSCRAT